jgi:transglutaminase-like putative cysteine protease
VKNARERKTEEHFVRDRVAAAARLGILLSSILATTFSRTPASAQAFVPQKDVAIEYEVADNGLHTLTVHSEMEARDSADAARIGQIPIPFSESMEDLDIVDAHTLKANGRKLAVDTSAIFPQLRPGDPEVPLFDDMRQKVIVFPDVSAGDTIVMTYKRRLKQPYFPGQFTASIFFSRSAFRDAVVTIRAPRTLPLHIEAQGLAFNQENAGTQVVYRWRFAPQAAPAIEPVMLSPYDRLPRLFVSSFSSYEAFGRAYAALAADKISVSPKIQALADEITAGLSDRRKQTQKLYEWVGNHIRYVAVSIGKGSLVPHPADAVLANGYGDCKDHVVLFASLLKAKGIASEIVLINADNSYRLPGVPVMAALNHAISYLPEFDLYADTTAGVAPFGILPIEEYGKPVVHAGSAEMTLRSVPVLPRNAASTTLRTVARLLPDGRISGTTVSAATGALSTWLRGIGRLIPSAESEGMAKRLLRAQGQDGKANFEPTSAVASSPSYSITAHFDLEPRPKLVAGDSFVPPVGLALVRRPGDGLMGPLSASDLEDGEETPCYSGRQTEELSLELPPRKHLVRLPTDLRIENDYVRYASHWSLAGSMLTVRREFSAAIDKPLCVGRARLAAAAALREIREDYRTTVALTDD